MDYDTAVMRARGIVVTHQLTEVHMLTILVTLIMALYPTCPTEDATNCTWVAAEHGNGEGRDFFDLNGTTYYVDELLE